MAEQKRGKLSVGILGGGAIGTLLGVTLAAGGADVLMIVKDAAQEREIAERGGLALENGATRGAPPSSVLTRSATVRVATTAESQTLPGIDILLVAVKSYATRAALAPLRSALTGGVTLISLQNGLAAEDQIADAAGRSVPLALGVTTEAATGAGVGIARHAARGTTVLGWPRIAGNGEVLSRFGAAMRRGGLGCETVSDIQSHVWGKAVVNAAINPVTALAGVTNGALLEDESLRRRAAALAREAARIAAACGVTLPFPDPVRAVEDVARATAANRSSMLQDLQAGRPTEIDDINGALVERGRMAGILATENARILAEVRHVTTRKTPQRDD